MELLEYNIGTGARAFSTMRGGGSGNYGGFNITHYCGDTGQHVMECRKLLCRELGIGDESLLLPKQTHGDCIAHIDRAFMQLSEEEKVQQLNGMDAIITDLPQTCIGVSTADCIPVLLHDHHRHAIAAVHAGWRGTVAHIVEKSVTAMVATYGCNPQGMVAVIGPGISLEAFEVGNEVYNTFNESCFPMEKIAKLYPTAGGGSKWHIDLWEANRLQLIASGIPEENISVAGICSYREHGRFFSARRLGIESGRIFSGIMLI